MNTSSLIESVTNHFPDAVSSSHTFRGDATVILRPRFLLEVARFLKDEPGTVPRHDCRSDRGEGSDHADN
jgi:hypothetical protein